MQTRNSYGTVCSESTTAAARNTRSVRAAFVNGASRAGSNGADVAAGGGTFVAALGGVDLDERFEADAQALQLDAVRAAQHFEVVQPLGWQHPRADHDGVDRRGVDQHRQRRVAAEDRIPHHPDAGLPRIVVDEARDPDVAIVREQLADHQSSTVAGAIDDHATAGPPLPPEEFADQAERRAR